MREQKRKGRKKTYRNKPETINKMAIRTYISIITLNKKVSKESACSAGDLGSIPGFGRSPGEGNGDPLQYPCLESLMDRGTWWAAVHGVTKSRA